MWKPKEATKDLWKILGWHRVGKELKALSNGPKLMIRGMGDDTGFTEHVSPPWPCSVPAHRVHRRCEPPWPCSVPALPAPLDELGEVATGQPHAVSTGQQPQDGDLIQQLPHEAESHVEIHGEQTCRKAEAGRGCQEEGNHLGAAFFLFPLAYLEMVLWLPACYFLDHICLALVRRASSLWFADS